MALPIYFLTLPESAFCYRLFIRNERYRTDVDTRGQVFVDLELAHLHYRSACERDFFVQGYRLFVLATDREIAVAGDRFSISSATTETIPNKPS